MRRFFLPILMLLAAGLLVHGCGMSHCHRPLSRNTGPENIRENRYYHFLEAQLAKDQGRLDKAISHMKKALAADDDSVFLQKELVVLYLQNNENSRALALIDEVLQDNPDDVSMLILAANIRYQMEEEKIAAGIYEQALAKDPDQEKLYLILGKIYLDNEQPDKAIAIYKRMIEQFPDLWKGYFFLGRTYRKQGEGKAAEALFRQCLELAPKLLNPRMELIGLYQEREEQGMTIVVRKGDTLYHLVQKAYGVYNKTLAERVLKANPDIEDVNRLRIGQRLHFPGPVKTDDGCVYREKIVRLYQSILKDCPDDYNAAIQLALYYKKSGCPELAGDILRPLGEKNASDARICQYVYQFLIAKEDYEAARFVLSGMLAGAPESPVFNYMLGVLFDRMDQPQQAIAHLSQLKPGVKYYSDAVVHIAYLYENMGKIEQAVQLLESLVRQDSEDVEPFLFLGSLYERQKEYDNAAMILERGLKLAPDNVELLFRRGVIYDKAGRKDAVVSQMKRVLSLDPDHVSALNYLGYTYAEQGIYLEEAKQLIEKALALNPDSGYITDSLGWVYYQQGKLDKALELLNKAVKLEPEDPILLEHLGDAYLKNGEPEKALEIYQRSLKYNQDSPQEIKEKIEALAGPETP